MFDLQIGDSLSTTYSAEVPDLSEDWSIGLIVGPSASGKSTVARAAFGDSICAAEPWPDNVPIIECLGDLPIKTLVHMLGVVGFNTPPSWLKPYRVLSNGERFRCDLARALLRDQPLVVCDEFTSCVDRTVARVGSAAVSKAIRNGRIQRRFIAVTCHYDVADWLQPDWVLDMASGKLARGRLHRPEIRLDITRCDRTAWRLFAQHHYLSRSLHPSAVCYLATWDEVPVGFVGVLPCAGRPLRDRVTRIVVLPDYQGVGIGKALLSEVGSIRAGMGRHLGIVTGHPGVIAALQRREEWIAVNVYSAGTVSGDRKQRAVGRPVVSFRYIAENSCDKLRP